MDNPYTSPKTTDTTAPPKQPTRLPPSRQELSGRFAIMGLAGGVLVGTVGYLALIVLIETLLTPPFKSPPNYGQFIVIVIGMGFYMGLFGVCLGVVPFVTWIGYAPIHLLGVCAIWWVDQQFFAEVDWSEAPIAAMIFLLSIPTFVAIAVDHWGRRLRTPALQQGASKTEP